MKKQFVNVAVAVAVAIVLLLLLFTRGGGRAVENFYNVVPTEYIDPGFVSDSYDRWAHYAPGFGDTFKRVGDTYGVDLNCNNVTGDEVIEWIHNSCPQVLYEYVLRYDPSVDIQNPNHTPRALKALLRNLPENHKFLPIVRKCFPRQVRV